MGPSIDNEQSRSNFRKRAENRMKCPYGISQEEFWWARLYQDATGWRIGSGAEVASRRRRRSVGHVGAGNHPERVAGGMKLRHQRQHVGRNGPVDPLHTTAGKWLAGSYALLAGVVFLVLAGVMLGAGCSSRTPGASSRSGRGKPHRTRLNKSRCQTPSSAASAPSRASTRNNSCRRDLDRMSACYVVHPLEPWPCVPRGRPPQRLSRPNANALDSSLSAPRRAMDRFHASRSDSIRSKIHHVRRHTQPTATLSDSAVADPSGPFDARGSARLRQGGDHSSL